MLKLSGEHIYLATLEQADCEKLWNDFEYDFEAMTEPLNIGHSVTKAVDWFNEIQQTQGKTHVRLGIFLNNGEVIGDVALQDIDWRNRVCSLGIGIAKLEHRRHGYGSEGTALMLDYAFTHLSLERVTANTLEQNNGAQKALERSGFTLEGKERQAVTFAGRRWDRYNYAILREEYVTEQS